MSLRNLSVNKEYQDLLPTLDEQEFQSLKQSIEAHGQHIPITVNRQYEILDGYHRYKACQELEIEPKILVQDFDDKLQEFLFVVDSNLDRRHLTDFQKTELAIKREKHILREIARKNTAANLLTGEKAPSSKYLELGGKGVNQWIGKSAGISHESVRKVEIILQSDDDDLKEKARKGQFTINQAFNKIKRTEKRIELLNEVRNAHLVGRQTQGLELLNGDFMEQSKEIPDSSIDLILTDPPYDEGSIPMYRELAFLASHVLRDGGSLVTYASNCWLPYIFRNMLSDTGIKYWWTFSVIHSGGHQLIYPRNVFAEWKPLLWFVKGEKPREGLLTKNMGDLIESQPPDKSLHEWTQSPTEAEFIIKNLTVEGQIVLDPLMGVGTFGLAALGLKRQFIGIEREPERFGIAETNLQKKRTGEGGKNS